jgi:hypothetical protein
MESGDDVPYIDDRVERLKPEQIGEIADAVYRLKH